MASGQDTLVTFAKVNTFIAYIVKTSRFHGAPVYVGQLGAMQPSMTIIL